MRTNAKDQSKLARLLSPHLRPRKEKTSIGLEHQTDNFAEDIDLVDVRDHKRVVVIAVGLEGTARPFATERRPVLIAGSRSLGIPHCQLRPEWEVEESAPRCHETFVAKRSTRSSPLE